MENPTKPEVQDQPELIDTQAVSDLAILDEFTEARDKVIELQNELTAVQAAPPPNDNELAKAREVARLEASVKELREAHSALLKPFGDANSRFQAKAQNLHFVTLNAALADALAKAEEAQSVLDERLAEVRAIRLELEEGRLRRIQQEHERASIR